MLIEQRRVGRGFVLEEGRVALKPGVLGLELRQLLRERLDAGLNCRLATSPCAPRTASAAT